LTDSIYEISAAFLRNKLEPFTAQEFQTYLKKNKIKLSLDEVATALSATDCVFPLINQQFITYAGAFTGRCFSFKPTREEVDAGAFTIGHRFIPFFDQGTHTSNAVIILNDKKVPKCPVTLSMNTTLDLFALYGEGYCIPTILDDPVCDPFSFSSVQYGLPKEVTLSGFSLEPYFQAGFEYGDRILCQIGDWDKGVVFTKIKKETHKTLKISFADVANEEWYSTFEECMLDQIELHGPASSIQKQLALLFLENQGKLCTENCGSAGDFLMHTTKLGFSAYGIESRIWRLNEDVPYIGSWNREELKAAPMPSIMLLSADHILDSYIKDMLYKGEKLDFAENLFHKVYPSVLKFEDFEAHFVMLHLEKRIDIVKKTFNRFNDFPLAKGRHSILLFFSRIMMSVAKISVAEIDLEDLPQQELITLTQMVDHTQAFLEELEMAPAMAAEEMDDMITSLNGMSDTFDMIEIPLINSLRKKGKKKKDL